MSSQDPGTPGALLRALRVALQKTQAQVAEETGGALTREYVVKIETGVNRAGTDLVRGALARVYGLTRDQLADYLDGRISLEELLAARQRADERLDDRPPLLKHHPRWPQLIEEAMRLRSVSRADIERVADTPFIWGPLETVDAAMIADLARDVADWSRRSAQEPRLPPRSLRS